MRFARSIVTTRLVWVPVDQSKRSRRGVSRRRDWRTCGRGETLTTDQQRRANRANAESSTGPKTASGKSRSAQNAFRHGLNLPVFSDLSLALEVEVIARTIAGPDTDDDLLKPARRIAVAEVDLERVRANRRRMLTREIENPNYQPLRVRKLRRALLANQERFSHGLGPAFSFAGTEETASRAPRRSSSFVIGK
jgi:hypothetical protein